ncbi:uncharacterized protein JCM6883_006584 [Sporobolomyces salmoneus]|uniref:uncharacterized protein n=1 Tax=Sporobolomyces salmoneus TaxID=183962 RepID=UPI003180DBF0
MSYSKLPYEVKELITEHVHRSEARYRSRQEAEHRARVSAAGDRLRALENLSRRREASKMVLDLKLRGKGISVWSRTLHASKAVDPIFQYHLLNTPAANAVTHLVLNAAATAIETDAVTLFHIAPRLPNLKRISVESLPYDMMDQARSNPHLLEDQRKMNQTQLVRIARSITSWHFKNFSDGEMVKSLLEANMANIQSLSLVAPPVPNDPSQSPVPLSLISSCESLSELSIRLTKYSTSEQPWFSDALNYTYSFANRLTSLSIIVGSEENPTGSLNDSILHFTSLFPSLIRLKLCANAISLGPGPSSSAASSSPSVPSPSSRLLPALTHLTLGLSTLTAVLGTLENLDLPVLEHLRVSTPTTLHPRSRQDWTAAPDLARRILAMEGPLRSVYLFSSQESNFAHLDYLLQTIYEEILEKHKSDLELGTFVLPFEVKHYHEKLSSEEFDDPPSLDEIAPPESRTEEEEEEEAARDASDPLEIWVNQKLTDVFTLAQWLQHRAVNLVNEEGWEEVQLMWKSMVDLHEYRKWLQE